MIRHERSAWWLALAAALAAAGAAWWAMRAPVVELAPLDWRDIAPPEPLHAWRWIVLHHSGAKSGDTRSIDAYHANVRGWEGIGYHFVVGNGSPMPLGRIEATFRWRLQRHGAHAGPAPPQQPYNRDGIGICLVGDYREHRPSDALERRVAELCAVLIEHVPTLSSDAIIGHKDVPGKSTDCPGSLDIARVRALVRERLAAGGTMVPPMVAPARDAGR